MAAITTKMESGAVVIPAELRDQFGLEEGSVLVIEAGDDGIVLRPADDAAIELYTPERIAEFLLNNAIGADDYRGAREEVRKLGLDPDTILHDPPDDWTR